MSKYKLVLFLALATFPLSPFVGTAAELRGVENPTTLRDTTALKPPADASVALIEFADLECPDCAHANPLLKEAAAKFGIPWVRHDFPLPYLPWGMNAAINARWFDTKSTKLGNEYRDAVFAAQASIFSPDTLQEFTKKFAHTHGIAIPSEIDPVGRFAGLVKADFALGKRIGIQHVPTIWVATANSKGAPFVEVVDRTKLYQLIDQAKADAGKRPMTFEDMMQMKRLGETAVSPDGKWLAYSVTTVNLEQNTKTAELFVQAITAPASGSQAPISLPVGRPGDSGIQFAPDGKRILFLSGREGGQQIWQADFDAATGATSNQKKLTSLSTEADNAKWSPDGKSIVFTSNIYPDCPAITVADSASGDKCNADRDATHASSKVKAQIFTHLLYRHWDHFTGEKRSHLFLLALDTGTMRDLTPNDSHDVPPFSMSGGGGFDISPDSKELAFTENIDPEPATSVSAKIFTLDLTNPAAKPVAVSNSLGGNFNPAYSPDGKYLAWRSEARAGYESDKFRLMVLTRATHAVDDVLPRFDNWVDEFAWEPHSIIIYFTSGTAGEAPIYRVAVDLVQMKVKGAGVPIRLTETGEYSDLHVIDQGRNVIAARQLATAPSEIVRINDQADAINVTKRDPNNPSLNDNIRSIEIRSAPRGPYPITRINDALLAQLELLQMDEFWFAAKDGIKVQGFIIRPPGFDAAKKYPVKFLIHGGPQGAWGDSWSYRWNAELFAANGYVVIMINPRGSTGYGQAFVDGVNGDWGGKPFTDLMEGLDYAEQHFPFIDKNRECALGASYGGYMANWVLGHTNRFKCIVSHDGMFDAESAFGSTEEDWFNIWEFKGHPWDYYGKPDSENPFRKWSPSLSAKNFKTPTLVVHSQLDYRLDVSEGLQLFDTLQLLKVPSKMLYFPDEGHWVLKPQNSQLWYKTVNDWVDEWTKPKD